ncbi:MAG TPA: cyanophycin synthetase [Pyrinomonadaceae bacterium]|jgi:dihydrofolate synthase/folylpolyglutamate synthase
MDFDAAVNYLLSLGHETLAMKLGLANVTRLLAALGDPQRAYPAVQIAGTNGKGSTAAMLAAVCRAAGVRAGLYTSPHLVSITERVQVDGRELAPAEFARHAAAVRAAAETLHAETGARPTFFEQVTAVALEAFSAARVRLAILETGLGGRLDATTAARAATVALTPLALDHQAYLGDTLAEIAAEKAAIIRAGARVVLAPQAPEAETVITARCRECGVTPRRATDDIEMHDATPDGRLRATFRTETDSYERVLLALRGRHQLTNAAVAVALAEELRAQGFDITRAAIIEGLERARHPGRLELRPGAPAVLLDGAHNPAGAAALGAYLDEFARAPVTLVFGAMADKPLAEMAARLFPAAARLVLTAPPNPRAAAPAALLQLARAHVAPERVTLAPTPADALRLARAATPPDGLVCVTGSLYLVGAIMQRLDDEGRAEHAS